MLVREKSFDKPFSQMNPFVKLGKIEVVPAMSRLAGESEKIRQVIGISL